MRRIALLALKPVGEAACARLVAAQGHGFTLAGICSNSRAEGTWWGHAVLVTVSADHGIPFLASEAAETPVLDRFLDQIGADMIVSIQYSRLLPPAILDKVAGQALNLHLAPLPAYRGFFGPTHALLRGDSQYGTTLHWMDQGADTGDLCLEDRFPIIPDQTGIGLYRAAEASGLRLIERLIALMAAGAPLPRRPQSGEGRLWRRDSLDGLRRITDPSDAAEMALKARAFYFPGFEPAYVEENGIRRPVLPESVA